MIKGLELKSRMTSSLERKRRTFPTAATGISPHGYFPGSVYTYEKVFTAPAEWEGKDILIEFEGIYKNATVSLNGKELCFHPYGYTGFFVELTDLIYDGENTLTVVADNSRLPNSRWYSGSGIYRPVWLHVCEKGGLRPESVKISTVSIDPAVVKIESPVSVKADVDGMSGEGTSFELTIPNAKLWSDETPYLYLSSRSPTQSSGATKRLISIPQRSRPVRTMR